jgi:hypothetical protein
MSHYEVGSIWIAQVLVSARGFQIWFERCFGKEEFLKFNHEIDLFKDANGRFHIYNPDLCRFVWYDFDSLRQPVHRVFVPNHRGVPPPIEEVVPDNGGIRLRRSERIKEKVHRAALQKHNVP